MFKADVPVHGRPQRSLRLSLLFRVHDIKYSLYGDPCFTHLRDHTAKGSDRPYQQTVIGHKSNELSRSYSASYTEHCSHDIYDQILQSRHNIPGDPVEGQYAHQADPESCVIIVLLLKSLPLEALSSKRADHSDTCQILLRNS